MSDLNKHLSKLSKYLSFWKDNVEDDLTVFFLTLFSPKKFFIKNLFAEVYAREKNFSGPFAKVYARKMQKFREFFSSRKYLLLK